MSNAIVLVCDRLGAGFVGPYGNTWIDTPGFNQLATQSLLVEWAWGDSGDLRQLYRSYWLGIHAASKASSPTTCLAATLNQHGIATALVTDDIDVVQMAVADRFQRKVFVPTLDRQEAACELEEIQAAEVLATAASVLDDLPEPYLLWIHARGLAGRWDAPWEMRADLADEEDPAPPHWTASPHCQLSSDIDPDVVLGIAQAYGAQVMAIDAHVDALLQYFGSHPTAAKALWHVTSSRGYPLGEHGGVGSGEDHLWGNLLQIPSLWRFPDGRGALQRASVIWQPCDMRATLEPWCLGVPISGELPRGSVLPLLDDPSASLRQAAMSVSEQEESIMTNSWFYCRARQDRMKHRLFVKPDDRWEVNDVADRCRSEVQQLDETIDGILGAADDPLCWQRS